jgi:hypothetical protein
MSKEQKLGSDKSTSKSVTDNRKIKEGKVPDFKFTPPPPPPPHKDSSPSDKKN